MAATTDELETALDEALDANDVLTDKVERLKQRLADGAQSREEAEGMLRVKLSRIEAERNSLKARLERAQTENEKLQRAVARASDATRASATAGTVARRQRTQLRKSLEQNESLVAAAEAAEHEREVLRDEIAELRDERLRDAERSQVATEQALETNDALKKKLSTTQANLEAAVEERDAAAAKLGAAQRQATDAAARCDRAEKTARLSQAAVARQVQKRKEEVRMQGEAAMKHEEKLKASVAVALAKARSAENKLGESNELRRRLEAQLAEARAKIAALVEKEMMGRPGGNRQRRRRKVRSSAPPASSSSSSSSDDEDGKQDGDHRRSEAKLTKRRAGERQRERGRKNKVDAAAAAAADAERDAVMRRLQETAEELRQEQLELRAAVRERMRYACDSASK